MPLLFQGCNGGKRHYDEQLHSASGSICQFSHTEADQAELKKVP